MHLWLLLGTMLPGPPTGQLTGNHNPTTTRIGLPTWAQTKGIGHLFITRLTLALREAIKQPAKPLKNPPVQHSNACIWVQVALSTQQRRFEILREQGTLAKNCPLTTKPCSPATPADSHPTGEVVVLKIYKVVRSNRQQNTLALHTMCKFIRLYTIILLLIWKQRGKRIPSGATFN